MNLLALDTATEWLSLALCWQGETFVRAWPVQQGHAERTLPEIHKLMAETGASLSGLDGLALSMGPGSFTGLRIGCGIVQGLAYGLDKPVVGINTLAALAIEQPQAKVLAVLDARMGELYLAGFERVAGAEPQNDALLETVVTGVYPPNALPDLPGEGWFGAGSGFKVQADALAARYGARLLGHDVGAYPCASGVLRLAQPEFAAGRELPAEHLQPLYVRNKVALKTDEQARLRAS